MRSDPRGKGGAFKIGHRVSLHNGRDNRLAPDTDQDNAF